MVYQRTTRASSLMQVNWRIIFNTVLTRISQPDPKSGKRAFNVLQSQFAYLRPRSNPNQNKKQAANEDYVGEYTSLMDQEFFDFVLFEIPWIV